MMIQGLKFFLVILTMLALLRIVPANLLEPTIGKSFFLHEEDISTTLIGGRRVLKDVDQNCYHWHPTLGPTTENALYFASTSNFYKHISTDNGISTNLNGKYTMGATLANKTQLMSSGEVSVEGAAVEIYTIVNETYVDPSCFKGPATQLADDLVSSFDYLPADVNNPENEASWTHYKNFLWTYGSHFVSKVFYGAKIKQWVFSRVEKGYTDQQLHARACADLFGLANVGYVTLGRCSGITQTEASNVKKEDMLSKLEILGGSDTTRNQLQSERTNELITKLLNEGRAMQTPIKYKFTAIWDILRQKYYQDDVRRAKANNLQQYYEGFLDFGCYLITGGGLDLRRFQRSAFYTSSKPEYDCMLEREGCHSNDDCTVGGGGAVTYCYGNSCVKHTTAPTGSKAMGAKIRKEKSQSYNEGVNRSCYYSWFRGKCDTSQFTNKIIWPPNRVTRSLTEKIGAAQ